MFYALVLTATHIAGVLVGHTWGHWVGRTNAIQDHQAELDNAFEEGIQAGLKKAGK